MEIKIDVKFNIGDKVYVHSYNNERQDTNGVGIVEGYVINKTKKSCKVYYLIEGRGSYRRKYRYTVGELELFDEREILYYDNHKFKIVEDKSNCNNIESTGGELTTEITEENFKEHQLLKRMTKAFEELQLGVFENPIDSARIFRKLWKIDGFTDKNTTYHGIWPKSITNLENGKYKVIFEYDKKINNKVGN